MERPIEIETFIIIIFYNLIAGFDEKSIPISKSGFAKWL